MCESALGLHSCKLPLHILLLLPHMHPGVVWNTMEKFDPFEG